MNQLQLVSKEPSDMHKEFATSFHTAGQYGAPLPSNEDIRLGELRRLGVLDSNPEQKFDDITSLVCALFDVPIAIVSLVDEDRQWFKSCVGLLCNSTDRKSSFCAWTLIPKNPEVLVVPDATEDVRCVSLFIVVPGHPASCL